MHLCYQISKFLLKQIPHIFEHDIVPVLAWLVTQRCKPQTINLDLVAERIPRRKRGRGVWMDSAPKKMCKCGGYIYRLDYLYMYVYIYMCKLGLSFFFAIDQSEMLGHFEIAALTSCHWCCRRCQVAIIQLSHAANWKAAILTVVTMWGPPVISWFINPHEYYSYKYDKL